MSFARPIVPGRVYLVTRRCTQRQFLLRPDAETTNAFLYCFAYAAKKAHVKTIAFIANSNHYHAVVIDAAGLMPVFLEAFHKLLAKHQNCLRNRQENFWASQQTSLVQLIGDTDILNKTIYTLSNPVKDHLVARADQWPGASSRTANLTGAVLRAERPARFFRSKGTGHLPAELEIECVRIPGFDDLGVGEYRDMLATAIEKVESDAADERRRTGRTVLGVEAILKQEPTDRPDSERPRREFIPHVAARDKGARRDALAGIRSFRNAYALMRDDLLAGKPVTFPEGTWWLTRFAGVPCVPSPKPD